MVSAIDNKCDLVLYHTDKRVGNEWLHGITVTFSKETGKQATSVACSFFGITDESDRYLFKSAFLNGEVFNWFNFIRKNETNITLGMKILKNRSIIQLENLDEWQNPIVNHTQKLSVLDMTLFGKIEYELSYDEICNENMDDFSVTGLFNSVSFNEIHQFNTKSQHLKLLKKIDLNFSKMKINEESKWEFNLDSKEEIQSKK